MAIRNEIDRAIMGEEVALRRRGFLVGVPRPRWRSHPYRDTGGFVKTTIQRCSLVLLFLLSSSCVTLESLARTRASHEFKCPEQQVVLNSRPELSDGTYDVEACGQRARYTCSAYHYQHICAREPIDEAPVKQ